MSPLQEFLNTIFRPDVFMTISSIFLLTIVITLISYLINHTVFRKIQQYAQSRMLINKILDVICLNIAEGTPFQFRGNFFLPNEKGQLEIRYSSSSMVGAGDYNLVLDPGRGATGIAWERKTPIVANLQDAGAEGGIIWGLTKEEAEKTKELKAILSIPTPHPKSSGMYIGVLSIDSKDDAYIYLQSEETIRKAYVAAMQIAEVLLGLGLIHG